MDRNRLDRWISLVAIAAFACALAWANRAIGWTPRHALALPGAVAMPGAGVFDLLAFVAPGGALLAAALLRRWRSRGDPGWMAGIASWLLAIAALAWIALGLSPVDAGDLAGAGGQRHAVLWMLWLVAASAAVVAMVAAAKGRRGTLGVLAGLWFVAVLVLPTLLGGWAQVLAAVAWMAWPWLDRQAVDPAGN